jgi:hypothetical protein
MIDELKELFVTKSITELVKDEEYGFSIHQFIPENSSFQLLVTEGLQNRKQEVNEANEDLAHIELYMLLPDYWNLEVKPWPVNWLERIARVPQKNDTWFGNGDTIPAGYPAEDMEEGFKANHFILSRPIRLSEQFKDSNWKASYSPLAVIPIFQTEVDFKLRNSHTILFKKFAKKGVTELIDPYRVSTCRKRVIGLF